MTSCLYKVFIDKDERSIVAISNANLDPFLQCAYLTLLAQSPRNAIFRQVPICQMGGGTRLCRNMALPVVVMSFGR